MNILPVMTPSNIIFRGYKGVTKDVKSNNQMDSCVHESHFMRNLESLLFTSDYIKENFPNGTHIAGYGCSSGEEEYSLGVLLHSSNKDKKYKITGYDLVPDVIEDAKKAIFNIGYKKHEDRYIRDDYEKFLLDDYIYYSKLTPEEKIAKESFYQCFQKPPSKWSDFNIHNPRYKHKVKMFVKPGEDIGLATKRLEYIYRPTARQEIGGQYFIPKAGVFDNVIDFKVADIFNIDKELADKKTGVVIFKNSLYHLLGSRIPKDYEHIDVNPAKELFRKINKVLPENGLFVLGILPHDHFQEGLNALNDYKTINQNGQQIEVFHSSPIHKALESAGFEPAFYECGKFEDKNGKLFKDKTFLPSVWKKVRSV